MAVCTLEDVRDALQIPETDTARDELIARLIGAATKLIENQTKRTFSTTVDTRYFDGNGKGYLVVDDFQNLGSVEFVYPDRTAWKVLSVTNGEVEFQPYNKTPHERLVLVNTVTENPYRVIGANPYVFPKGFHNIRCSGIWGSYSVVPEDIRQLGIDLIIGKLNRIRGIGTTSISIGGQSMSFSTKDFDDGMRDVIKLYRRNAVELW